MRPYASSVWLTDLAAVRAVEAMGFKDVYGTGRVIEVRAPEDDSRIAEIFSILARFGFFPCKRAAAPVATNQTEFCVRKCRVYSPEEVADAELLRLRSKPHFQMARENYPRGGHEMEPEAWRKWCYECLGNDDEGWRVMARKGLSKRRHLGGLYTFAAVILSSELKAKLEKSDLKGLNFIPVRYDKSEKAPRQFWQFGHKMKMPTCLLPRLTQWGEEWKENHLDGAIWDENGYKPEELRFNRTEVEAMGEFDVATTREKIGEHRGFYRSEIIVTQRFRKVLNEMKINAVDYIPVRLAE